MKTATQTSLIRHYEDEFRSREVMRAQIKQDEKKLDYNSSQNSKNSFVPKIDLKQYASNNSG